MRQSAVVAALCCALGFLSNSHAIASPNTVEVSIICPNATGTGYNSISNFGGSIAGYGREYINNVQGAHSPYFSFDYVSGHFPPNLANGNYSNNGVEYDPSNSLVICKFVSGNGFDPINVTHKLTNGYGGLILTQSQDEIVLLQYVGLR